MRDKIFRRGGLWFGLLFLVVVLSAASAYAQQTFETTKATVTINDSGISLEPSLPNAGPVSFTVVNNTNRARGLVITGTDRANTPIIRYSELVAPGKSGTVDFWLFQGQTYTFRDFLNKRPVRGEMRFRSVFSTSITYPMPAGVGTGPSFPREQVAVTVTNSGLELGEVKGGPTTFIITNNSSKARGVYISGTDRVGNPIRRYSKVLRPGQTTKMDFWLYGERDYTIKDFTRNAAKGKMVINSTFTQTLSIPKIPLPPRFEGAQETE